MFSPSQQSLRVHRFLAETQVEGPGRRAALWVQGCPIRCPGCANAATWSFNGGYRASVGEIFDLIRKQREIEGVTFIGGEPFSQARPLATLGRLCREQDLSVITFTGYDYGRLLAERRADWNALMAVTDLLLAGPFIEDEKDFTRPWVGSLNQKFIFLTSRYLYLQEDGCSPRSSVETHVEVAGTVRFNGLLPVEDIMALRRQLAALGLRTRPKRN